MKNNIKAARESQGLTQQECAELFNVKLRAWQTYEQGVSEPKFEVLCKIADKFGVATDYLLGRPDAKPPEEPLDEFARKEHLKSLEKVFMKKYLALTEEQRDKVLDFLRGVLAEETAAQASKLKMSRVYEAARSDDPNNAPHFAEYPEEELKKLDDDPDTDFDL